MSIPKVAIACQGGGSHAAFAAGVLTGLLRSEQQQQRFELVALSGSSGGAMCASLLWRGLVSSGPREAVERLLAFWRDL
ncbi:MAG TPA: patatin-like phospholipase family protein, partial [Polyangiaceae bacterium]|nr:patatin-like phospholipase family protein [Polyangiaceae bacterium]